MKELRKEFKQFESQDELEQKIFAMKVPLCVDLCIVFVFYFFISGVRLASVIIMCVFSPELLLHSRVVAACPVTTDFDFGDALM